MNYKNIFLTSLLTFNIYFLQAENIVIKNATIYNGIDNEPFVGNILIEDGMIKRVSVSSIQGDKVIDASGKIVTPGFHRSRHGNRHY